MSTLTARRNGEMDEWRTGLVESMTKYRADRTSHCDVAGCDHALRVEVIVDDKTVKRDGKTDGTTLNVLRIQERRAGLDDTDRRSVRSIRTRLLAVDRVVHECQRMFTVT